MRFLVVAPRFHTNLYYRVIALQNAGHTVKVIVLYKGKSEFYENIEIQQVKLSRISKIIINISSFFRKRSLKSTFELRVQFPGLEFKQILKEYKPDVILLKAYQNMLAVKTLLVAKKNNVKVLMLTQTYFTHIKGSTFLFKLNIKFFKYMKVWAYITPIKSNYNAFKNFGIKNVFYLPFVYPVNNKRFNKTCKNEIKIISVGKFQKRKDQILLLKAFKKLRDEGYKIKLCLVGELADEKYFALLSNFIKESSLLNEVCIKINMTYPEINEEYENNDVFVLPAYSEPAAYSIVEAMAKGLPVICSDQNGTSCYIKNGINGYVFEAKKEEDLIEKIKLLIFEKEIITKMSIKSIIFAKEYYNIENFEKMLMKIVKEN